MPKIERGRISGEHGMSPHPAEELRAMAYLFEVASRGQHTVDDPRRSRRWAAKLGRLARGKERSVDHKSDQKRLGNSGKA